MAGTRAAIGLQGFYTDSNNILEQSEGFHNGRY